VGGQRPGRGRVRVVLKNEGTAPAAGPVALAIHASPDGLTPGAADMLMGHLKRLRVKLAPGESKTVTLRVKVTPPPAGGNFQVLASASGTAVSTQNVATGAAPLMIEPPLVDLAGPPTLDAPLEFGKTIRLSISVTNRGNVTADDPLDVEVRITGDGTVESSVLLATARATGTRIPAGATRTVHLAVDLADSLPILAPGNYSVLARIASTGQVLTSIPVTIR
jgi:uncharacterized membrane protein